MKSLTLIYRKKTYLVTFTSHPGGMWTVHVDQSPFAVGRRVAKNEWLVVHDQSRYSGKTLSEAATSAFYGSVSEERSVQDLPIFGDKDSGTLNR